MASLFFLTLVVSECAGLSITLLNRFDGSGASSIPDGQLTTFAVESASLNGTEVSARQLWALRNSKQLLHPNSGMNFLAAAVRDHMQRTPSTLRLKDLWGSEYSGPISVGTPQETMSVIYDTGSSELWIASDLCNEGPCTFPGRHRFNHSRSKTFTPGYRQTQTSYGSGRLSGSLGQDTVQVGGLVAHNQFFSLIENEMGPGFQLPIDGIVGLGFRGLSESTDTPLVDNLLEQGELQEPEFSFYLHRDVYRGGAVLWGQADSRLYHGPLTWFPVVHEAYWSLGLAALHLGNTRVFPLGGQWLPHLRQPGRVASKIIPFEADQRLGKKSSSMHSRAHDALFDKEAWLVVDSGTTFFQFPPFITEELQAMLPDEVSCSEIKDLPPMTFTLRAMHNRVHEVNVPPTVYMIRGPRSSMCYPAVAPMDMSFSQVSISIIGEVFMRHFFTVFHRGLSKEGDFSKVGFAPAVDEMSAENVLMELTSTGSGEHSNDNS